MCTHTHAHTRSVCVCSLRQRGTPVILQSPHQCPDLFPKSLQSLWPRDNRPPPLSGCPALRLVPSKTCISVSPLDMTEGLESTFPASPWARVRLSLGAASAVAALGPPPNLCVILMIAPPTPCLGEAGDEPPEMHGWRGRGLRRPAPTQIAMAAPGKRGQGAQVGRGPLWVAWGREC